MHDDILGTLLFGAENNPLFRRAVAAQATRALSEIDNLSAVSVTTDSVSISTFEAQASEIVHHLDPNARMVTSAVSDDHIPAAAAVAMLGALTQAVTNSVIHAGAGGGAVQRMVTFTGASRELNIRIHDNGVGFNPSSVPSTRLGIRSSIHGRMNSIPGCFSTVESTPGSGTTVDLRWQPVRESPAEIGERSAPPQLNAASLRVVRIVVGIFAVGQVLLCALSSVSTGNVLGSIVALIALSAPIIFLVKRHYVVDATVVTFVVVGVLVAASMLFFQGADAEGGHAEVWFLDSGAVLLMVLLYSGHGRLAWGLMGVVAAIFLVDSLSQQSGGGPEFGLIVRPIALLLTATLLSVPLKMFQPRINALRAESRRILGEKIFVAATTAQRQSEAVRLQSLAGPLLQTLARSEELTHSQVAECVALEGLLRDQARGNRLSRGELKRAAGRARTRGIDVMLLDDSDGEGVTDSDILTITNWMSEHLEKITEGQFVGRVLPTGRPDMATIVMSGNSGPLRMSLSR
jgi:signal transduction histidine kinase